MTQSEALEILKTGRNVFLTGAAGSGKTYVLRQYIDYLKGLGASMGLSASTGIAATHMGGTTLHSWSGIGINDSLNKSEVQEIADKSHIRRNIKETDILIIDEVSMLHHFQLDMVDRVVREVKEVDTPFGGMQIVFCGDFFQLPPVQKESGKQSFFGYHSKVWQDMDIKVCYLHEQYRQKDAAYLKILNAIRSNSADENTLKTLESRFNKTIEGFGEPTKLYSHNRDVDRENAKELSELSGRTHEYHMEARGNRKLIEALKKSCLAPEILGLKKQAKVMFVKNNFEEGYVNGTLGIVEDCGHEKIIVKTVGGKRINVERMNWSIEEDGRLLATISQYPLRLAWAITVHKSQGMSLDAALIDLRDSFEKGMGYVALSRVRSLDGLSLLGLNHTALQVSEEILAKDTEFQKLSEQNRNKISRMGERVGKMQEEWREKISKTTEKKHKHKKVKGETL
ncbi:MAG: PIF1 family DEAD/DEAH box helicase, partial [Patescibacteria group bacterium]